MLPGHPTEEVRQVTHAPGSARRKTLHAPRPLACARSKPPGPPHDSPPHQPASALPFAVQRRTSQMLQLPRQPILLRAKRHNVACGGRHPARSQSANLTFRTLPVIKNTLDYGEVCPPDPPTSRLTPFSYFVSATASASCRVSPARSCAVSRTTRPSGRFLWRSQAHRAWMVDLRIRIKV